MKHMKKMNEYNFEDDVYDDEDEEIMNNVIDSILNNISNTIKDANEKYPELDVITIMKEFKNELTDKIKNLLDILDYERT